MKNKCIIYASVILLCGVNAVLSYDRFVNYTAALSVYDFAADNDMLWVASSGGLYGLNTATRNGTLYSDPALFPDPAITTLCLDANHTLWIGSMEGYLYKRPRMGPQTVIKSYLTAGWGITDIVSYGKYLIIGSDNGCSVFDTAKLTAVKNAAGFGASFVNSTVNAVAVFRDTLLLGCEEGVAKLYIGGAALQNANFYDQSIWTADTANRFPVKSFVVRQDRWFALHSPGAMFQGRLITTSVPARDVDSTQLLADSTLLMTFPSRVTSVADGGRGLCFIGTKFNYFYLWNGSDAVNLVIDGPKFTMAQRVYVDREGLTWALCPQKVQGISVLNNGRWNLYNGDKYPGMGWPMELGKDIRGVAEDRKGRMWFGTTWVNVKRYDRDLDAWNEICIGCLSYATGQFFQRIPDISCASVAKCDAIALDSTGFLWFASYNNDAGTLICFDPRFEPLLPATDSIRVDTSLPVSVKHYRYFFPPGDPVHSMNIGCLCVDAANNIIVGEGTEGNGKIHVIRHLGNPLQQGISAVTELPSSYGIVFDAATTPDMLTYIATSNGLYTLDTKLDTIGSGLMVRSTVFRDTVMDATLRGIQTVEMEDGRTLWLGTVDSGLIRYDLLNNIKTAVTESDGLLSNRILDLSFDRKDGYLWIASERGVSRYSLGYSVGKPNTGTIRVYPNPFSKRRHVEMIFEKLPPSAKVFIYTVSGALVSSLSSEVNSSYGSACIWKPPAALAPGIYLYAVQASAKNSLGKIIVTP
jgi:hypothetical protein